MDKSEIALTAVKMRSKTPDPSHGDGCFVPGGKGLMASEISCLRVYSLSLAEQTKMIPNVTVTRLKVMIASIICIHLRCQSAGESSISCRMMEIFVTGVAIDNATANI